MSGRESGDIDSFPGAAHALTRIRRCRGLLLDLRAKLGDLALEGPLVHEVRVGVRLEDSRQIAPVGLQLTGLPIEREHHHSAVLRALGLHGTVGHERVERQLHGL